MSGTQRINTSQVINALNSLPREYTAIYNRISMELCEIIPNFNQIIFAMYFVNNVTMPWASDSEYILNAYEDWVYACSPPQE